MRRNRPAIVLAALGVVAVTAFGSMSAAFAAPGAPSIDSPSDGSYTMADTVNLSGTTEVDTTVTLYLDGSPIAACTDLPSDIYTGYWECLAVPLAMGVNTFTATANGIETGMSMPGNVVTVMRYGNDGATIDFVADTTDTTPTFTGTGPALGTVDATLWVGESSSTICTAAVAADSSWSCESTVALDYGETNVGAIGHEYGSGTTTYGFLDATFWVLPPKPTFSYAFGPASITVTASGLANSVLEVELYKVTDGVEGYEYGAPYAGCPYLLTEGTEPIASPQTCSYAPLAPGIWNFSGAQSVDGYYSNSPFRDDYVLIPAAPTLDARVNSQRKVVLSGNGVPFDYIVAQTTGGTTVCETTVGANGTWSCTITASTGAHSYRAFERAQGFVADPGFGSADASYGGTSAYSNSDSVTVPAPAVVPTPTPTPTPATTPAPIDWTLTIEGDDDGELTPDEILTLSGSDLPPGSTVVAELHSDPIELGTTTVDDDGTFTLIVTIPKDAPPGDHEIVVLVTPPPGSGSAPGTAAAPVKIVAPENSVNATSTAVAPRQEPGTATALTDSVFEPSEILTNPLAIATAGSLGLAFVLAVLVPAEFFGESLANQYSALGGFFSRRRKLKNVVKAVGEWVSAHRAISGASLVVLTSAVFCFVDPGFGFDLTSLRLLLSCAVSILMVNFASAGITELIAERALGVPTRLQVMPWGLMIAAIGVLVSRLLDFTPGFLIGAIIGVSIVGSVGAKLESRIILLWSGIVWGIAVAAWASIGLVPTLPASDPASFWTALLSDSLVATSAAGLTALIVALLPIALFDGGELFAFSKRRWGIAFGVAVASFCLIVLPSSGNWLNLGSGLGVWLLCTVIFVALAIVAYLFARARSRSGARRSRLLGTGADA